MGAGGNCGNQSAIAVIRALALGELDLSARSFARTMARQLRVGLLVALGTTAVGAARVALTDGRWENCVAISASLFAIVMTSCVLGAALPFALGRAGVDPANAGTVIQVVMDVLGVLIMCTIAPIVFAQLASGGAWAPLLGG